MNKEHFLIELKLHLRQLSLVDQQAVLEKYEELFTEKTAQGLTEYQITKELESPKDIAMAILKEFNLEFKETTKQNHDWVEISNEETQDMNYNAHPYYQNNEPYRAPSSGFIRFFQISGVICLNLFFMFWMILCWAIALFVGWAVTLAFIFSPILGISSVVGIGMITFGLFQLFISLLLCGIGLIGLVIMIPFSKVSLNLLKTYTKWNIQVLKGDRAL